MPWSPTGREVHAVSLKQRSSLPPAPLEEARAAERRSDLARLLLAMIGAVLLTLSAGVALADSVRGVDTDALRGTEGDDRLTGFGGEDGVWGLGGDDELYGGAGRDLILGGTGDDFVGAKDGDADLVACGPGKDVASVDSVDRDCETLYPG